MSRRVPADHVGIGLVGTGVAGRTHVDEIAHLRDASVAAVFGRNTKKTQSFADEYGIERTYTDFDAFLADNSVDVLTPHGVHLDYAVPAAEAGKHVIAVNPWSSHSNGVRRSSTPVSRVKSRSASYTRCASGTAQKPKRAVDAGELGRLILVDGIERLTEILVTTQGIRGGAPRPWRAPVL